MTGTAGRRVEVGDRVAEVLRAAYYYALVDGHPVVNPGLLLMAAARNDDRAGLVLGRQVAEARATMPRGQGPDPADDAGSGQGGYAGALREAGWWVLRDNPRFESLPVWSGAIGRALTRAAGSDWPAAPTLLDVPHLLLGLLDSTEPSVAALTDRVGLDIAAARQQVQTGDLAIDPAPFVPLVEPLQRFGGAEVRLPWSIRWIPGVLSRFTLRTAKWGGPVLACLEREVMRQSVLLGHGTVRSSAVLLAIVSLDVQLAAAGERLRTTYLPHNQGGRLLVEAGFDLDRAWSVAEPLTGERETLPAEESSARFWDTGKPGDPSWSVVAVRAMDRATGIAREHGHQHAGTSHLLAAVLTGDGTAGHLLAELNLDREELRRQVTRHLGQG